MSPDEYFFRYAFPCTEELLNRRWVSKETFNKFTKAAHELALGKRESIPARQEMESAYKNAFRRIKRLAAELKNDYWSIDVIREYFLREHNACIEGGEDHYSNEPESFKELCRVQEAQIIGFKQTVEMVYDGKKRKVDAYMVSYEGKERPVFNFYNLKDLKGKVRIHYAFIIEKV
jgi:hypothetical protein